MQQSYLWLCVPDKTHGTQMNKTEMGNRQSHHGTWGYPRYPSIVDRTSSRFVKDIVDLNNIVNEMILMDVHRTLNPNCSKHVLFMCTRATDWARPYSSPENKLPWFLGIEVIWHIASDHSGIKVEIVKKKALVPLPLFLCRTTPHLSVAHWPKPVQPCTILFDSLWGFEVSSIY